jgi:hypothetical protein
VFFFYDILVYSKDDQEHLVHLRIVLEILLHQKLFAKAVKCKFACKEVEYLGQVILAEGVKANPAKDRE